MSALFRHVLGEAFDRLPGPVRQVHGGPGAWRGRARARGGPAAALVRRLAGLETGAFPRFRVEIAERDGGEAWSRRFGARSFRSMLRPAATGSFTEQLGPLGFHFGAEPCPTGFDWLPLGWKLGPLPLPRALMPRIRARSFARDGVYRFRVRISHPWCGLIIAYAGSLETAPGVGAG